MENRPVAVAFFDVDDAEGKVISVNVEEQRVPRQGDLYALLPNQAPVRIVSTHYFPGSRDGTKYVVAYRQDK